MLCFILQLHQAQPKRQKQECVGIHYKVRSKAYHETSVIQSQTMCLMFWNERQAFKDNAD